MAHGAAHTERLALAATLDATDPAAPTLCAGWDARMLAAHLVLRDRRPDLQVGMLVKPLGARLRQAQEALATGTAWPELVEKVREGPRFGPTTLTAVDDLTNTLEFVVHHEDIRRGLPGWEPRELPADVREGLRRALKTGARLAMRGSKVPLVLADPAGEPVVIRRGADPVVVTGGPAELALWVTGRRAAAQVELTGPPASVAAVLDAPAAM